MLNANFYEETGQNQRDSGKIVSTERDNGSLTATHRHLLTQKAFNEILATHLKKLLMPDVFSSQPNQITQQNLQILQSLMTATGLEQSPSLPKSVSINSTIPFFLNFPQNSNSQIHYLQQQIAQQQSHLSSSTDLFAVLWSLMPMPTSSKPRLSDESLSRDLENEMITNSSTYTGLIKYDSSKASTKASKKRLSKHAEVVPTKKKRLESFSAMPASVGVNNCDFSINKLLKNQSPNSAAVTIQFEEPPPSVVFLDDLPWMDGRRKAKQEIKSPIEEVEKNYLLALPTDINENRRRKQSKNSGTTVALGGHVCQQCGKSYATSSNLSRHKQTHRPLDSPYAKKCPFCDRIYVSMPALGMHILTHKASHKCPICGKLFSRPWLLKGHLRSHTGQKPFSCGNCGKAFSDRSNLRAHLNTHKNEKNFECKRCARKFSLKSYLNKHSMEGKCYFINDQHDEI